MNESLRTRNPGGSSALPTFGVHVLDVDGDERQDILCAAGGSVVLIRNRGAGQFEAPQPPKFRRRCTGPK